MNPFECCRKCVAPKRHPGCGGTCTEYQKARKKWDDLKQKVRKEQENSMAVRSVLAKGNR